MDDRQLAGRASTGDLDSFGQLYDRYFQRVYDFAWRVLRDGEAAADVTRETFTRARRELPSLAKSGNVAAALFTIAHRQALGRAGGGPRAFGAGTAVHEEAFGTFEVPDASRIDRPEIVLGDHELAALVWEALTALNAQDYALLDLHIRQGLDSADLVPVLDVSKREAASVVSRMKVAAAGVITSYIVARRGAAACAALQQVLAPFDFPPYSDAIRRAVDQHIAGCRICQQTRDAIGVEPLIVFGAFAPVSAPMALKGDIWRELSAEWRAAPTMTLAGGGFASGRGESPYGDAGIFGAAAATGIGLARRGDAGDGGGMRFGPAATGGGEWDRNRVMWFAGGAVVLLVLAFAGAAVVYSALGGGDNGSSAGPPGATRTVAAPRTPTPAGTPASVGVTTPTAKPTASPTVGPSETPTPPATPTEPPATSTPVPVRSPTPPATATRAAVATSTPKPGKATPTAGVPTRCPPGGCPLPTP
ncbi:MAG: hypothetical protein M3P30_07705 [Chloroflexota bacterium]|nr:hypothetical protein [Chloroflexota bacterium]